MRWIYTIFSLGSITFRNTASATVTAIPEILFLGDWLIAMITESASKNVSVPFSLDVVAFPSLWIMFLVFISFSNISSGDLNNSNLTQSFLAGSI